jgi:LPXTG-motif cell wall-anchored protein
MISAPIAAGAGATAMVGGVVMLRRRNRKNTFDAS